MCPKNAPVYFLYLGKPVKVYGVRLMDSHITPYILKPPAKTLISGLK